MTEDVAMQQQSLFVALGGSAESSRIRQTLQLASLVSDMSAFKAANPGSVLVDFVRWHSPKDCSLVDGTYVLSARMTSGEGDNVWQRSWAGAAPTPAHLQLPLFDTAAEADKVLASLEALSPAIVCVELLAAAFAPCVRLGGHLEPQLHSCSAIQSAVGRARASCDTAAIQLHGLCLDLVEHQQQAVQQQGPANGGIGFPGSGASVFPGGVSAGTVPDALRLPPAVLHCVGALGTLDMEVAKGVGLLHLLPGATPLVHALLCLGANEWTRVDDATQRSVLRSAVIGTYDRHKCTREYVLRSKAQHNFLPSAAGLHLVHRMFASVTPSRVIISTAIAESEL